jgi:pimeloyl-ACP methyl ester carboxylesterase
VADFCLVHGAWHDGACWEPLLGELEQRGHTCVTPVLPLDDEHATFVDYAGTVLAAIADVEAPVVVGHSMASAVIPLLARERLVPLLVYVCPAMSGFPPRPDEPPRVRAGNQHPPHDGTRAWWPHDRAVSELYGRLPRALAERCAAHLRPQPLRVWQTPYPLEQPPAVPSAFVYGRDDEILDGRWSRWIACNVFGVEPIELPTGHFPMLEAPALLASTLDTLVREPVASRHAGS